MYAIVYFSLYPFYNFNFNQEIIFILTGNFIEENET